MPRRFLLLYPFFDAERRALPVPLAGSTHRLRGRNCRGVYRDTIAQLNEMFPDKGIPGSNFCIAFCGFFCYTLFRSSFY